MVITRTLTKFKATAVELKFENGEAVSNVLGVAEFFGTRPDKTGARKAIADKIGKTLPKGCHLSIEDEGQLVYGMQIEEFMAHAQCLGAPKPRPEKKGGDEELIG